MSPSGCFVCEAVSEVTSGDITIAMAVLRGLSIGGTITENKRLLCLRHCNGLHEYEQWDVANAGNPPGEWSEEPRIQ